MSQLACLGCHTYGDVLILLISLGTPDSRYPAVAGDLISLLNALPSAACATAFLSSVVLCGPRKVNHSLCELPSWSGLGSRNLWKRNRHTFEQIIRQLRTALQLYNRGQPLADVLRSFYVSAPTCHRWHQLYSGMRATEAKRLSDLEQKNAHFKSVLADAELD